MSLKRTTPVPNAILDDLLPHLSISEFKILVFVVRKTQGWRKPRDWISQSQFVQGTGLTRQTISQTLAILQHHKLIRITNRQGLELNTPQSRRGKARLYYALGDLQHVGLLTMRCKVNRTTLVGLFIQDKRHSTKENLTNEIQPIANVIPNLFK